jgi:Ankyrin repeat
MLSPEEQHRLYLAARDGNVSSTSELLMLIAARTGKQDVASVVNTTPFESLWHEPGPDATCLHLAACAIQPILVRWLLDNGADRELKAGGRTASEMVHAFDLFARARLERPEDVEAVEALLGSR